MITEIWGTSKFKDVLSKEAQPRQFPEMNNVIREFITLHLYSQLTKSIRICASFNNALHINSVSVLLYLFLFFSFHSQMFDNNEESHYRIQREVIFNIKLSRSLSFSQSQREPTHFSSQQKKSGYKQFLSFYMTFELTLQTLSTPTPTTSPPIFF